MHLAGQHLPKDFVAWAKPETVVVSGKSGVVDSSGWLEFERQGIEVLRTEDRGAIAFKFR